MLQFEAVYIMANRPCGALYIGRTKNLIGRVWQHRTGAIAGHTRKYNIHKLVYYEYQEGWEAAWSREKQLKRYRREWKFNLIEAANPGWKDLWFQINEDEEVPFAPMEDL
ncbi:MAG: GIY-YIG nuclease family protein [Maricaulis sp.]|jgi:putative endonuclease|nr:GIY-YIG nuclease family protein [Maricaulis sp.]